MLMRSAPPQKRTKRRWARQITTTFLQLETPESSPLIHAPLGTSCLCVRTSCIVCGASVSLMTAALFGAMQRHGVLAVHLLSASVSLDSDLRLPALGPSALSPPSHKCARGRAQAAHIQSVHEPLFREI